MNRRLILALACAGCLHLAHAEPPLPDWMRYYQMAAERGDPEAQMKMGWAYEKGDGVPRDDARAVEWYRRAALQNEPTAQYNLALLLIDGRGVAAKDTATGVDFLTRAASQNLTAAQAYLAAVYERGEIVPKNDAERPTGAFGAHPPLLYVTSHEIRVAVERIAISATSRSAGD